MEDCYLWHNYIHSHIGKSITMNTYMLSVFVGLRIPLEYFIITALALLALGYYLGKRK
jgi:hypothetical protein